NQSANCSSTRRSSAWNRSSLFRHGAVRVPLDRERVHVRVAFALPLRRLDALVGDSDEVADERPLLLYRAPQPAVKNDDAPLDLLVGEEPHRRAGLVGVLRVVVLAGLDAQPEQCLRLVRVLVRRPVLFLGVDLVADRAFVREEWDGFFGLCCLGHWDMLLTAAAYTASVVVFLGGGLVTGGPLLVCGRGPAPPQER